MSTANRFPTMGQHMGPGGKFLGLIFLLMSARTRKTMVKTRSIWTSTHFHKEEINTEGDADTILNKDPRSEWTEEVEWSGGSECEQQHAKPLLL